MPARAAGGRIDGLSDQSLPAWDGAFQRSPLAGLLGAGAGAPGSGIVFSRYVVQWDAPAQPSVGPSPGGDYRERFEAWLADVGQAGLIPVLALTSYDGVRPRSPAAYQAALLGLLSLAAARGLPIRYLEPWNEPNGQGHESPMVAAGLANVASGVCRTLARCTVIAGDFLDGPDLAGYERAYERALAFSPGAWGVHPYLSVAAHDDAALRTLKAGFPSRGLGAQVWLTEVGALYCSQGQLRGEGRQASDASYLVNSLIRDPTIAPVHVFYYGLLYADRRQAPCSRAGGQDSELFAPGDRPRAAAAVVLPQLAGMARSLSFGPGPGEPQPPLSSG